MDYETVINFLASLCTGFISAGEWLNTPISFLGFSIIPLHLLTFSGLTAFVAVAIIKWVAS